MQVFFIHNSFMFFLKCSYIVGFARAKFHKQPNIISTNHRTNSLQTTEQNRLKSPNFVVNYCFSEINGLQLQLKYTWIKYYASTSTKRSSRMISLCIISVYFPFAIPSVVISVSQGVCFRPVSWIKAFRL